MADQKEYYEKISPFLWKTTFILVVKAALETSGIDQVVVSTDDPEIAAVAKAAGADVPFMRPSIWQVIYRQEFRCAACP